MMTPVERLLAKLPDARQAGNGWSARCPAHEDNRASLSVRAGDDGRVLVYCHAGCKVDDICSAVGLKFGDLRPSTRADVNKNTRQELLIAYDYRDETGKLLFQVCRFEPKDFRQRKPKAGGGWDWSVKGVRIIPYRLATLLSDLTQTVFIVEGEKDVENLARIDVVATCNAGGAGKWSEKHSEFLRGREVAILADNDTAGVKHALQVAQSLHGVAKSVRIVDLPGLPEKGDVSDWIKAGGTCEELMRLVDTAPEWTPESRSSERNPQAVTPTFVIDSNATVSEQLVALALHAYRLGRSESGDPFAVRRSGPNVAISLRGGGGLRSSLARLYREHTGKTPAAAALSNALITLEGAAQDADAENIYLRLATHDDSIVIDLGDVSGRVVIVTDAGWEVRDVSPVLFRRTALTSMLPTPERGGHLNELAAIMNVSTESWQLVVGWLIASLLPDLPHAIALLCGLQGTGKSCAARMLTQLVDPSPAPLRSEPNDIEQWQIAASGSWIVAIDNLSSVRPWFSDALCKAVTGDGLVRRRLYTDSEVSVLAFRRVVLLTSIDAGSLRGDLGDRLMLIDLEPIDESKRRTEHDLMALFHERHPRLLGALLDALAMVLGELPNVRLSRSPRMADFARVLAACDRAGVTDGALDLFTAQRERIGREVIDGDPFALALVEMMSDRDTWSGTASELLDELLPDAPKRPRGWPAANRVSGHLKRIIPALASKSIVVDVGRRVGKQGHRVITMTRRDEEGDSIVSTVSRPKNMARPIKNATLMLVDSGELPYALVHERRNAFIGGSS